MSAGGYGSGVRRVTHKVAALTSRARNSDEFTAQSAGRPGAAARQSMSQTTLIVLAESCSTLRGAIGRMLLTAESSPEREKATAAYELALRSMLRAARDAECGIYLEVAGDVVSRD